MIKVGLIKLAKGEFLRFAWDDDEYDLKDVKKFARDLTKALKNREFLVLPKNIILEKEG